MKMTRLVLALLLATGIIGCARESPKGGPGAGTSTVKGTTAAPAEKPAEKPADPKEKK